MIKSIHLCLYWIGQSRARCSLLDERSAECAAALYLGHQQHRTCACVPQCSGYAEHLRTRALSLPCEERCANCCLWCQISYKIRECRLAFTVLMNLNVCTNGWNSFCKSPFIVSRSFCVFGCVDITF